MDNNNYDVIIIGSGMGALTTASFLSRVAKKKVLILEQHFKIGGFTHIFKRKNKYLWDVGIHYIGGLEDGGMIRRVFDALSASQVKWHKMPHNFEKFVYPDFYFEVPDNEPEYIQRLVSQFPDETQAIQNYFKDIKACSSWYARHITMKLKSTSINSAAHLLKLIGNGTAHSTAQEYIDANFKSRELGAILLSQWGDYGLPPSQTTFIMHSLVAAHYLNGGWYPIGGSGTIAEAIVPWIKKNGGDVLINHHVQQIIVDNQTATGVRVQHIVGKRVEEKVYRAPVIISGCGARNTYLNLLPSTSVDLKFKDELEKMPPGTSCVTLYLGLNDDPAKMGFEGENHWIFSGTDHTKNFATKADVIHGHPGGAFLSFPSLKDPSSDHHTAEIIAFCDYAPFAKWAQEPWLQRSQEYQDLKKTIADGLIGFIDQHYPAFSKMIEYQELSTPLSNEHFTKHYKGSIYGLPVSMERFQAEWLGVETPVKNLYLTGVDVSSPGVSGAIMGGLACAAKVMGLNNMVGVFRYLEDMAAEKI